MFAAEGVVEARCAVAEFSTEVTFSGYRAIGFHFIDYVVHTWDVARALDVHVDLPDDLWAAALPIAELGDLVEPAGDRVVLTVRGRLLANEVALRLA